MTNISDREFYCLMKSMDIALSDQTNYTLRLAAEAVASAILNGASESSLRSVSIAILINENLNCAISYVDEILDHTPDNRY